MSAGCWITAGVQHRMSRQESQEICLEATLRRAFRNCRGNVTKGSGKENIESLRWSRQQIGISFG